MSITTTLTLTAIPTCFVNTILAIIFQLLLFLLAIIQKINTDSKLPASHRIYFAAQKKFTIVQPNEKGQHHSFPAEQTFRNKNISSLRDKDRANFIERQPASHNTWRKSKNTKQTQALMVGQVLPTICESNKSGRDNSIGSLSQLKFS